MYIYKHARSSTSLVNKFRILPWDVRTLFHCHPGNLRSSKSVWEVLRGGVEMKIAFLAIYYQHKTIDSFEGQESGCSLVGCLHSLSWGGIHDVNWGHWHFEEWLGLEDSLPIWLIQWLFAGRPQFFVICWQDFTVPCPLYRAAWVLFWHSN